MDNTEVTQLLDRVNRGEPGSFDALVSAVYADLRHIAASLMRRERGDQTLQPTALVHEAWMGLAANTNRWDGRAHFFGAAARAMRQVLVGHARQRASQKRAGDAVRVTFRDLEVPSPEPEVDLLSLDEALTALARVDERLARVMEMRYYAGLTLAEIADLEGRSLATIKRDWSYARAWLYDHMGGSGAHSAASH